MRKIGNVKIIVTRHSKYVWLCICTWKRKASWKLSKDLTLFYGKSSQKLYPIQGKYFNPQSNAHQTRKKMDILIEMPAVFFYNSHLMSFYGSVMRTRDPWIVMNESSHWKYFWKVCPFLTNMREWKICAYYTHKINRVLQIIWIKFAMNVRKLVKLCKVL